MGRSKECDLPINEKLASRQHVRIELRRDKFFIIDQSTNGTHVKIDNGEEAFLRREEMPLSGSGQISLGKGFNEQPSEVINFIHVNWDDDFNYNITDLFGSLFSERTASNSYRAI